MKRYLIACAVLFLLVLSGCGKPEKIFEYRLEDQSDITTLADNKDAFKKPITISYMLNEKYASLAKKRTYTFVKGHCQYNICYSLYEVKKVKGGYQILNEEEKGFTFPSPKAFDEKYSDLFTLNGTNGSFTFRFKNYEQLSSFVQALDESHEWEDILNRDTK